MFLTLHDHTGHRGEVERGELDKDDHLQQHQQEKISCCLVTKCWAGGGGEKKNIRGFCSKAVISETRHAQHTVSSTGLHVCVCVKAICYKLVLARIITYPK